MDYKITFIDESRPEGWYRLANLLSSLIKILDQKRYIDHWVQITSSIYGSTWRAVKFEGKA